MKALSSTRMMCKTMLGMKRSSAEVSSTNCNDQEERKIRQWAWDQSVGESLSATMFLHDSSQEPGRPIISLYLPSTTAASGLVTFFATVLRNPEACWAMHGESWILAHSNVRLWCVCDNTQRRYSPHFEILRSDGACTEYLWHMTEECIGDCMGLVGVFCTNECQPGGYHELPTSVCSDDVTVEVCFQVESDH